MGKTEQQLARVFLKIGPVAIRAQHRQIAGQVLDCFSYKIVVLAGVQWNANAVLLSNIPCPHPRAIDNKISRDRALIRVHTAGAPFRDKNFLHLGVLHDRNTPLACALGQRRGQINRVVRSITWHINTAQYAFGIHQRPAFLNLACTQIVGIDAEK